MAWIGAVVGAVSGIAQMVKASNTEIDERKEYTPGSQMKEAERMAKRRAEQGLSATERALYEQRQAGRTASAEKRLRNLGMQQFVPSMSAMYDVQGSAQIAALSEQERRRGEQMYAGIAGQMQAIKDRETTSFNQMVQQQEQALGQAYASGAQNLIGAAGTAAQAANTAKLAEAYGNSGDTININMGGDTKSTSAFDQPMSTQPLPQADMTGAQLQMPAQTSLPNIGMGDPPSIMTPSASDYTQFMPQTKGATMDLPIGFGSPVAPASQSIDHSFAGAPLNTFGGPSLDFIY